MQTIAGTALSPLETIGIVVIFVVFILLQREDLRNRFIRPGWAMALETLVLFLVVEGLIGQVIEPWLYGHNTGISPIAVVISAIFWTWLWGPIGLVLSTPLTICLVVLGRRVEQLNFLDVILGDAPALTPVETFYQRVLVGDASEVAD